MTEKRLTDPGEPSDSTLGSKGFLIGVGLAFVLLVFWIIKDEVELKRTHAVESRQHEVLHEIEMIEDIGEVLDPTYFRYDYRWHRNSLTRQITFPKGSADIDPGDQSWLMGAARAIQSAVHRLKTQETYGVNFTFTVLIEGRSSNDGYPLNHELSFKRALAVKRLWDSARVFAEIDSVDLQVAGSGPDGIGREMDESQNQRILVHIIPKIGHLPDGLGM